MVDVYEKTFEEVINELDELTMEVTDFDSTLIERVKWLVLNKIDLISESDLQALKSKLQRKFDGSMHIYCISAAKKIGTQQLMRDIGKHMELSHG